MTVVMVVTMETAAATTTTATAALIDPAKQRVIEGVDFMLEHFGSIFPRSVATLATSHCQVQVNSREEIIQRFEESDFIDCYMSIFPAYNKKEHYKPNHIFIDIDRQHFTTDQELEQAVEDTIQNIRRTFGNDVSPTISASGNGIHIHLPIDMPGPLEDVTELSQFKDVSNEFLRYLERRISNWKSDPNHNISFRSSLFRVPGTYNLKCIKSGKEPSDVKIIKRWNKVLVRPSLELLHDFLAYMTQKEIIDKKAQKLKRQIRQNSLKERAIVMAQCTDDPTKADYYRRRLMAQTQRRSQPVLSSLDDNIGRTNNNWIENILLQTPIDDYRKEVIFWILVPYLCTIKDIQDDDEIHQVVDEWLDKCEQLRRLEPSRRDFDRRIDDAIEWARDDNMLPTKLQTIKEDYPDLYKKLMVIREGVERGGRGGEGGGESSWR
jgi:hypothetical protein